MDDKICDRVICFNFLLTPGLLCLVAAVLSMPGSLLPGGEWPWAQSAPGSVMIGGCGRRQYYLDPREELSPLEYGTRGPVST